MRRHLEEVKRKKERCLSPLLRSPRHASATPHNSSLCSPLLRLPKYCMSFTKNLLQTRSARGEFASTCLILLSAVVWVRLEADWAIIKSGHGEAIISFVWISTGRDGTAGWWGRFHLMNCVNPLVFQILRGVYDWQEDWRVQPHTHLPDGKLRLPQLCKPEQIMSANFIDWNAISLSTRVGSGLCLTKT